MKYIPTEGKTIFFYPGANTIKVAISILSVRGAKLVLRMSRLGKWAKPVVPFIEGWTIGDGYLIIFAFQPKTGLHLAIKNNKKFKSEA
jgi:hypothetical protein